MLDLLLCACRLPDGAAPADVAIAGGRLRRDGRNVRRGLTPIRRLLAAGVPVALATNNVRNPFTPVPATITTHAARILNPRDSGCAAGSRADLVLRECERVEDIVASLPPRRLVVKNGRISVEHERRAVERWCGR